MMNLKSILSVLLFAVVLFMVDARQERNSQDSKKYNLVCYISSWAYYRRGAGEFDVSLTDPNLCTHAVYAYAKLHNNRIEPNSHSLDLPYTYIFFKGYDGYRKLNDLKKQNPSLKTFISIGGWTTSNLKFSYMAADPKHRATFVQSVVEFLHKYGFDGLDVDWQYPTISRGGRPEDKLNFALLLQDLNNAFEPEGFGLTVAVSADKTIAKSAYDIYEISNLVDLIHLKSYDFHGSSEKTTGFNAPLFAPAHASKEVKEKTVDYAVSYWLSQGVDSEKLVLGLSSRGSSFTLDHPSRYGVGSKATKPGRKGQWTKEAGTLGFNEICKNLRNEGWAETFDSAAQAPYSYKGNQWVGYDNHKSISVKVDYLMQKNLAGAMMFIDTDDFRGSCYGKKYFLLSAAASKLL